ncbi:hypothetical protein ACJRO7_010569 [Eucalyptus globulus]|uniref:Uncharacterized protein n=1 Tax=Eucalyptus globulus TaxID=34317 RepID=A0ABD3LH47_EUCGL
MSNMRLHGVPRAHRVWGGGSIALLFKFLGAFRAGFVAPPRTRTERPEEPDPIPGVDRDVGLSPPSPLSLLPVLWSFCWAGFDNDPSAGSPTETLLRLLLPLNDKVQWTSRDVIGGEPPTSPRSEHFTGPFNR